MAVAPAAGAGEPGSGSGETARHAAPRGAGRPSYELLSYCLCSMVLRPVERLVFSPKER